MSTLDKPKKNGAVRSGMTMTLSTHADGSKSAVAQILPSGWYAPVTTMRFASTQRRVKKGCGQRKNKRDKAGRALHAEICRINQRYPGADVVTIRAQLRSGQLDR